MRRSLQLRLRRTLLGFMLLPAAAVLGGADAKKKAIRREMIEMDIAVRNLTSIIALGESKQLDDSLARLVAWQMKDHPDLGSAFREVLAGWQSRGLARYGSELQKEAHALRSFAAQRRRLSDADWSRINTGFHKILMNCQNCHEAARKEAP